jgi:transcriptional regulator with XRE-family HTH domain
MLPTLLKSALTARNISIREAAEQIGISHTTLIALINNNRNIDKCNIGTLKSVCAWLDVPVSIVLDESIDPIYSLLIASMSENPRLMELYKQIREGIILGKFSYQDFSTILEYAEFLLNKKTHMK